MKDEYIIINKIAIQQRIEELEKMSSEQAWGAKIAFKEILSQSTPLIPEIEKSIDYGIRKSFSSKKHSEVKQDYISNLKLDI